MQQKDSASKYTDNPISDQLILYSDKDLINQLICKLCLGLLRKPFVTCSNCNQVFCSLCIQGYQKFSSSKCPLKCTKERVTFQQKANPLLETLLEKIKIKCPNSLNQDEQMRCSEELSYSNYQHHLKHCAFSVVLCSNKGCNKKFPKKEIAKHELECPFNKVTCEFCQSQFTVSEIVEHYKVCDYMLVKCPQPGCKQQIQRVLQEKHSKECEFRVMICEFCKAEQFQKDIDNHLFQCDMRRVECEGCKVLMLQLQYKEHKEVCPLLETCCEVCSVRLPRKNLASHSKDNCIKFMQERVSQLETQQEKSKKALEAQTEEIIQMRVILKMAFKNENVKEQLKNPKIIGLLDEGQAIADRCQYFTQVFGGEPSDYQSIVSKNPKITLEQFIRQCLGQSYQNLF